MRIAVVLVLFSALSALGQVPPPVVEVPRGFHCHDQVYSHYQRLGVSVGLPVPARVTKFLKIPSALTVKLEWVLEDTLIVTLDCRAAEDRCCCGPGAEALAQLGLFQVIRPRLGLGPAREPSITEEIAFFDEKRESENMWEDVCRWPGAIEASIYNYTGSLGIRAGLEWLLSVEAISVEVNAEGVCRCNSPYCETHSLYPEVRAPSKVVAVAGEGGTFSISIDDPDHDAIRVIPSQGARVVMVEPDPQQPWGIRGAIKGAVIWVPDWMEEVRVQVYDACGHGRAFDIPVVRLHRPSVSVGEGKWEGCRYELPVEVWDEDLWRDDVWDSLEVWLEVVDGEGEFVDVFNRSNWLVNWLLCRDSCPFAVLFYPSDEWRGEARLRIRVCDLWDLCTSWEGRVRNEPPRIAVEPASLEVKRGEGVTAHVAAWDPDGHRVRLVQVSGPGKLEGNRTLTGIGSAVGTYTWTATGYDPWQLVEFKATDACGATDLAYLLIHVLQPPRVGETEVWVPRGGTAVATVYVRDPDSPSHTFSFRPPAGISVEVLGREPPREYEEVWGGAYYTLGVRVDGALCPGSYPVPFTVADPDGMEAWGTVLSGMMGMA